MPYNRRPRVKKTKGYMIHARRKLELGLSIKNIRESSYSDFGSTSSVARMDHIEVPVRGEASAFHSAGFSADAYR